MLLEDGDTRTRRCKTFKYSEMLLKDVEASTCTLAKILPETTARAYFREIENASPTTNTFFTFSTNLLYPCMYTRWES